MVLPGSLTYRTYGYLMVAYAVEQQWGAAIELALVRAPGAKVFAICSPLRYVGVCRGAASCRSIDTYVCRST